MRFAVLALLLARTLVPEEKPGEPFPFEPAQRATYLEAFAAVEKGEAARGLPLAEQLVEVAPGNPRAWRILGFAQLGLRRWSDAQVSLGRALDLGIDPTRRPSTLVARAQARKESGFPEQALADVNQALALEPKDPGALQLLAVLHAAAGRWQSARSAAEALVAVAPENGGANLLLAAVLASAGEGERAGEAAARARALGANAPVLAEIDSLASRQRWTRLAWQVPAAALGALAAALLLFWGAGTLLSRVEVRRLGAVDARLLRDEQTPGERLVDRLYNGVLWGGTVLFFASVPFLLVITLAVGLGLIVAMFTWLSHIPVKLVLILLLVALGGAWAIVRGLFLPPQAETGGRRLTEAEQPGLFAALRRVAGVAGARMVDRVHVEMDAGVGVREAGGTVRVLLGRGQRVLHLGFAALRGLAVSELEAVLAHEYGHFSHGETRLTPLVARIQGSLFQILVRMGQIGRSVYLNPVYWWLRLYFRVYLQVTAGHSRRRELLADRAAAMAYGGETFASALARVVENALVFERVGQGNVVTLRATGRSCRDLYRCLDAVAEAMPADLRARELEEALGRKQSAYDSHPPPRDRFARVAGIPPSRPLEAAPAITLLADPDALAREITAAFVEDVDRWLAGRGELPAEHGDVPPEQEGRIAAALWLHRHGSEAREQGRPEAPALLATALARLEGEVGPRDPAIVPVLKDLAAARHAAGDRGGAEQVLLQALRVLDGAPAPLDGLAASRRQDERSAVARALEEVRAAGPRARA